jgi:hypothetical protein
VHSPLDAARKCAQYIHEAAPKFGSFATGKPRPGASALARRRGWAFGYRLEQAACPTGFQGSSQLITLSLLFWALLRCNTIVCYQEIAHAQIAGDLMDIQVSLDEVSEIMRDVFARRAWRLTVESRAAAGLPKRSRRLTKGAPT